MRGTQSRFTDGAHCNEDISAVDISDVPQHDLLVGGFPCQDYSVAKPLNQAHGIQGRKGVLWWEIYRLLEARRPRFVMLENVDFINGAPYSVETTNTLTTVPAGSRRDFWLLTGTVLNFHYTGNSLQGREYVM